MYRERSRAVARAASMRRILAHAGPGAGRRPTIFAAPSGGSASPLVKVLGVLSTIPALGKKLVRGGSAHEWVGELAVLASAASGPELSPRGRAPARSRRWRAR